MRRGVVGDGVGVDRTGGLSARESGQGREPIDHRGEEPQLIGVCGQGVQLGPSATLEGDDREVVGRDDDSVVVLEFPVALQGRHVGFSGDDQVGDHLHARVASGQGRGEPRHLVALGVGHVAGQHDAGELRVTP